MESCIKIDFAGERSSLRKSQRSPLTPRIKYSSTSARPSGWLRTWLHSSASTSLSSTHERRARMVTILGAGGAISHELVKLLAARKHPFRLVGRNPRTVPGATETVAADLTDRVQTIHAVAGSSVVHLLVGLNYDHKVSQEMWPRIMSNTIEACKRAGAKLIFFDNVYIYGKVSGSMTEETPFKPCSKTGEV